MKTVSCPECGWVLDKLERGELARLDPDISAAVRRGRRRHRAYHNRCLALGVAPAPYQFREAVKRRGDELLTARRTLNERVRGAKLKVWGWYHRSLEQAINRDEQRNHPSRSDFQAKLPLEELFDNDVAARLRQLQRIR